MWCWRRMEKISWTDHVRNEEVLLRIKEKRNIIYEIAKRKANCIGHILRRNCLLQRVIEGKIRGGIEVTGRQRRRRKLLDDFKERRGYSHLQEEALDSTMWTACFGKGFGPVIRQTTKWMNEWIQELICFCNFKLEDYTSHIMHESSCAHAHTCSCINIPTVYYSGLNLSPQTVSMRTVHSHVLLLH